MRILCIPDTQCKPGVPLDHLTWAGKAICDYKPDVVVHLGDHWDFPSLSSHDKPGSKYFEGKRYMADVEVGNIGMDMLLAPLKELQKTQKTTKHKVYKPRMVFLRGNHEHRLTRAVQSNPMLEGLMTYEHLNLKDWEVHEFLKPVFINGVGFSHYLPTGAMGRPAGNPATILTKHHMSFVVGHQQSKQIAYGRRGDGKPICAIIAGSYYLHTEDYMDHLSNKHWRGLVVLNDVKDGTFDELMLSIQYLERKYGNGTTLTTSLY
jgi:hypothetical protein